MSHGSASLLLLTVAFTDVRGQVWHLIAADGKCPHSLWVPLLTQPHWGGETPHYCQLGLNVQAIFMVSPDSEGLV